MSDKRRHARASWLVEVQVLCVSEDVHWNVRLMDISEGGCFIDTLVPLTAGSAVHVKLTDPSGNVLEIPGKILYGQTTIGSAIAFDPLDESLREKVRNVVASRG